MFDGLLKKLFGDKNQKDLNELLPIVGSSNEAFHKLKNLSDDELRGKTHEFREIINKSYLDLRNEVKKLKEKAKSYTLEISEKETIY